MVNEIARYTVRNGTRRLFSSTSFSYETFVLREFRFITEEILPWHVAPFFDLSGRLETEPDVISSAVSDTLGITSFGLSQ